MNHYRKMIALCLALTLASPGEEPPRPGPGTSFPETGIVSVASDVGTAEAFGGGDLRLGKLRDARVRVTHALASIGQGIDTADLCGAGSCRAARGLKEICHVLSSLKEAERSSCRDFLVGRSAELLVVNADAATPLALSEVPLTARGPGGELSRVAAVTRRDGRGAITFHYGTVQEFSTARLIALLVHELGHKVPAVKGGSDFVDDARPVAAFAEGRAFLDAAGAALAMYAEAHPPPPRSPPPLPDGIVESDACRLVRDSDSPWLLGVLTAISPGLPSQARLEQARADLARDDARGARSVTVRRGTAVRRWLAADTVREAELSDYFARFLAREPTKEEVRLFLSRARAGQSEPQLMAAILGDAEFARRNGVTGGADHVDAVFRAVTGTAAPDEERKAFRAGARDVTRSTLAYSILTLSRTVADVTAEEWFRRYVNRDATELELERARQRFRAGERWRELRADILASDEYASLQRARWKPCPEPFPVAPERTAARSARR